MRSRPRSSLEDGRHELLGDDRARSPGRKEGDCEEEPRMRGAGIVTQRQIWRQSSELSCMITVSGSS